ncbi:MAG: hypothetical protein PHW62_04085, partial [Candidatus Ratteibacteria bacterium]|nr:hypothetical protein [Candidatus Ratteibacteria bacterium]
YEIGIGGTNRREPVKRTLLLYGKWKIRRNAGLSFEIRDEGKLRTIKFGADAKLNKTDEVQFSIKNEEGKDLGMELKLSRKLLAGDGEAFIKFLKDKKEAAVYIGAGWRW